MKNQIKSHKSKKSYDINFLKSFIRLGFLTLMMTACQSQSSKESKPSADPNMPPTWSGSMSELKYSLNRLMPLIVDSEAFNSPQNQKQIDEQVQKMAQLSKDVNHSPTMPGRDPSVRFISGAFSEDLKRISEGLENGKREYARYGLLNVTSYCIECHTRTSSGPSFSSPELDQSLNKLKPLEKAEYHIAAREFDKAYAELAKYIETGLKEKKDIFGVDRAVRYALAVAVKYDKSPSRAMDVVKIIEDSKDAPFYLKQNAISWKLAIKEWMLETPVRSSSAEAYLKQARKLTKLGAQSQALMVDQGGDIYFLRALSDLHLAMSMDMNKEQLGESLYLTGLGYERIKDLALWSLDENYFEACIRSLPHSSWSEKCFKKLQESIYLGYTGSSGVHIPMDVQLRLSELQKMALSNK